MRRILVLLAAVTVAIAFAAPAGADVNLSGIVAFQTYMVDVDNPAGTADDGDLDWTLDRSCSRLTINFKEGPVSARYEIRPHLTSYVRHWWAAWNFGAGTLGIGQTYSPEYSCITSTRYGCGSLTAKAGDPRCSSRVPYVWLGLGNLELGAVEPNIPTTHIVAGGNDWDTSMPKLVAAYKLNLGMVGLKFFGGWQSIEDCVVAGSTATCYDIDSHVLGVTATVGVGRLTIKGAVWTGQNVADYGTGAQAFSAFYDAASNSIRDSDWMAYQIDLAFKVSDMVKVTAGYISAESESDRAGSYEDPIKQYHVNAEFTLAKGVTITPEYMVLDYDDITQAGVKTEEKKETYIGVYWQIAF
ncbi:MAG TPA: porin [Desulfatiglandales bacterium]|nr:porin [Desulfatiglandales bacterium]